MTNKWKELKLGEVLILQYGKGLPKRDRINGNIPVFGSGGVVDYHNESYVEGPGIIVGRKGSIGTVYYEENDYWPIDTVYYVKLKSPDFYLKFIYYLLLQSNLSSLNTDAAVPGLNRNVAHSQNCSIPPLPAQRKIAVILSAYDDLIENNTRRIQILEEMAQTLYREWFIHFRFPGHENIHMVESGTELSQVPEGWEVKQIGDVIEVLGGGTPSTKVPEYWDNGDINWFAPKDLTATRTMFMDKSPRKITELGLRKSSANLFPPYSVMMTSRATLGVTAINTLPACTNQGFITCIPNEQLFAYYIYFWIEENLEKIIAVASGATFKEITKTAFKKFPIIVPSRQISDLFQGYLSPIGKLVENLQAKTQCLRTTRDLLLPKLVTGEVDVSEKEIEVREAI